MTLETLTRELRLEVAHNVRHLGGYETADGKRTNAFAVRSAGLHRLTPAGLGTLADAGVEVIVDLRSRVERERDATPAPEPFGIRRVEAAVFEQDASPAGLGENFAGFAPVYRSMLEIGKPAYRTLFTTMAETHGTVLFHCAAGKDRTGLAAALLLELLEVADETIVADYALSERLLAPQFEAWLPKMRERGIDERRARALMASEPEVMRDTLAHIRERYGSGEGYLRELGLTPGLLQSLRQKMVA